MIGLRELRTEDAAGMLDWLNDEEVNQYFSFSSKEHEIDYAINYINKVKLDEKSKHFAIVDDQDEYMGTISLKNIVGLPISYFPINHVLKLVRCKRSEFVNDAVIAWQVKWQVFFI